MTGRLCKRVLVIIMLTFFIITPIYSKVYAEKDKRVVMVVINQVNYHELLEMESMKEIIGSGGVGLLNTRTAGKATTPKAYSTIGSGVRAEANWLTTQALPNREENKNIYYVRTGRKAPKDSIINPEINKLIAYNKESEYGAEIGRLGTIIRNAGYKTAAYGNMDSMEDKRRPHVLIAMDKKGIVDEGDISSDILLKDPLYPGGIKTDYQKIYNQIMEKDTSPVLTVIETGDISRLEAEKDNLSSIMYQKYKKSTLKDLNSFIEKMKIWAEKKDNLLMVVTPFPSIEDLKVGNNLTPIILYGNGINKGLLNSATTRRTGIVGNVDVAPTILNYLNLEKDYMVGNFIDIVPDDNNLEKLLDMNEFTVATSKNRLPVLTSFAIYQIVLLLIALFMVLFKKRINAKFYFPMRNLLLSGLVIPVVLLYLPVLKIKNLTLTYIGIILSTFILSYITYHLGKKFKNPILPIVIISLLMTIGLMGDVIMGSPLIRTSLFGYDPIIGARYYGIGNEFMGVLVGAALVLVLGIKELFKIPKWLIIILLIPLIIVIGHPTWGANVGGTLTATAATIFIFLRIYKIKIGWKQLIFGALGMILIVSIMAIIDTFFLESQSHLAGAISSIKEGGIVTVFMIISRKLAMNIRLFGITIWSKVLVTSLLVFAILFYKPYGEIKSVFNRYSYLSIGWSGIVVASIVGFVVNDSGVVAAATSLIYLSFSLLYILIQEPHNS